MWSLRRWRGSDGALRASENVGELLLLLLLLLAMAMAMAELKAREEGSYGGCSVVASSAGGGSS
jgi:hypothetical protein